MAQVEPMDIDNIVSDFDDKENSLQNSNVLSRTPCTEKGYEELDVSELNMKLRYSITPASSPMSKSFTSSNDNKTYNLGDDSLNNTIISNANLTRSLNSTVTKCEIGSKCPKLPLQVLPTDQYMDINSAVRRPLDNNPNDITITINGNDNIDENLSLPSTSSSTVQTPEATTPTKDIPKNDSGSPIMRGLKSVLNMFRSSQSPIPPESYTENQDPIESHSEGQVKSETVLSSTPKAFKNKDSNSSKRSSPLKDSVVFNDDLERELQWKDETTILFKEEKIPIHKLFLQQSTCAALEKKIPEKINDTQNLNNTFEYMDISYNESCINDKTMTDVESKIGTNNIEANSGVESDGEFLDCETTYTKNEQVDLEQQLKTPLPDVQQVNTTFAFNVERNDLTHECDEKSVNQLNEHRQIDMINNTAIVSDHEIIVEANNVQTEEENVANTLNAGQSDANITNKVDEQAPDVPVELKKEIENCVNDEIHLNKDLNVTTVLNISVTTEFQSTESNNVEDQPNVLLQYNLVSNDETTTDLENTNNLPNIVNCVLNETINLRDEDHFDVTRPLNIVTDYQDHIYENNDSSHVVHIEKENLELNKNDAQALNSGILQIFENISENNEHPNNLLNVIDLKSITNSEEIKLIESDIEQDQIINCYNEYPQENVILTATKNNETDETSHLIDQNAQKTEADKVESTSIKFDNDISYLDNQPNSLENIIATPDLNENNPNNDKEESINTIYLTNDLENNNLQNNENDAKLHDLVYNELKNNLPSDIPLPSDDDMEKDSLSDSFVMKNDNIEQNDVEVLAFAVKDEIKDVIETMDIHSGGFAVTISQHSNDLNNALPLPNEDLANLDQIPENNLPDNISGSLTSNCELLNNKSEMTQDLPDNKSISLTDTVHETNHQFLKNTVNLNQEIINDPASVVEHLDLQSINSYNQKIENEGLETHNSNNIDVEFNSNILNDVLKLKESKDLDEEIVTSANNSPYVSVNDVDLNDIKSDDIENPFETKTKVATSPPISPKLTRKGYNIDFDLIEDPFTTKTNIRLSPPPETSPTKSSALVDENIKKTNVQKRVLQQNRRKSQPERQKRDVTKKRFNNSYNCDTKYSNSKEQKDKLLNQNSSDKNEVLEENNRDDLNCTVATPVLEDDDVKPKVYENSEIDSLNISEKNLLNPEMAIKIEIEETSVDASAPDKSIKQNIASDNTSVGSIQPRNVFNLPEIDDMNFNPFVSKSKIRNSPSPTHEIENILIKESKTSSDLSIEVTQQPQMENLTLIIEKDIQENKVVSPDKSSETSSSKNTDRDFTIQEIHTEDEDTIEGPFLEAEEFADVVKVSDFGTEADMMQFEDLPVDMNIENKEDGELFIDAEAFEFLLNQNKSNVVADSGKESLFLKFDPLFAKRISSDGMLAALSRIQKRQSTPKKTSETSNEKNVIDEEKASVSSLNAYTLPEETNDEANITITKPMMVVNPAVNSLVSPRKSTTPPRINRRSLTFTSPAMAVIDRLLSLSGNGSILEHDTTLPRPNREYNETDVALTQLRELLAEKEIHVHNLRSESKELKERLATMESQVKTLEKETEERLKKVNDLNERLAEKSKINKSMAIVVEEYERTIASLIAEMEQEKRRNAEERTKLIGERDEQTAHLASMEVSFSDLHSKYEKSKQIILSMKSNEDTYRKSMKEFEDNLLKMQNNYELLKQHATSKLNHANQELEKFNRAHESEVLKLNAMIKRKELHITSLEESLAQKTKANEELTAICDELINKVG